MTASMPNERIECHHRDEMVGIFWLVEDKLILDVSPITEGEPYGECLGHRRSHIDHWEVLRRNGQVDLDSEYDEFPRGRVVYNVKQKKFYLLLDRCIRRNALIVRSITEAMHLPDGTIIDADHQYRCPKCLQGRNPIELE
jgi:hypothetical protein